MVLKKNRGITLVALVITIIILLILSGISIQAITNTGLFKKAKEAKEKTDKGQAQENKSLIDYEDKIQELTDYNQTNVISRLLKKCELSEKYTKEDIINNKDGILEIILNNSDGTKIIIENSEEFKNEIIGSENDMKILKQSKNKKDFLNNDNWFNKIMEKQADFFDDTAITVPILNANDDNIIYSSYDSSTYDMYKAFDNNKKTAWLSAEPNGNEYIGYNFRKEVMPYKISIVNFNLNGYRCKNFYIEGKEKNSNEWKKISDNLVLLANDDVQDFIISSKLMIEQIRIIIVDKHGGNGNSLGVAEFHVYCR